MVNLKNVCSNAQRPGKAVRISGAARMCYRLFNKPRSGSYKAGSDFRLPTIGSAHHAWMLTIDGEFAIRNPVGECGSPGEKFVSFADFTRYQQRVAQCPVSHGKLRWILVFI